MVQPSIGLVRCLTFWAVCSACLRAGTIQSLVAVTARPGEYGMISHQIPGLSNSSGEYGQKLVAEASEPDIGPGRDAAGNVLAEPFTHDEEDDRLQEGTVHGGSPCQSILEVLLSERLDTTRAVLQAGLGRGFGMVISPFAELTLLAPSEDSFAASGYNASYLPPSIVAAALAKTYLIHTAFDTRMGEMSRTITSIDGEHLTITRHGDKVAVHLNGTSADITKPDIPACRSFVHVMNGAFLELWSGE